MVIVVIAVLLIGMDWIGLMAFVHHERRALASRRIKVSASMGPTVRACGISLPASASKKIIVGGPTT
jgi:hypothetical protein